MTKALFRKQMMEVFSWIYKNRKSGKLRTAKETAGYVLLILLIFVSIGSIFFSVAGALCNPLLSVGMGWLYWCLMGLISVCFGVLGSVFHTYSGLYRAKDNDFLLAMPIPVSRILLVRLTGVYAMGLMYELLVMIPTLMVWFYHAPFSVAGTVSCVLIPFVLSILNLILSAILGWVVAWIAARLKQKNAITVFASLVLIAAYYYFYSQASAMLQTILAQAEAIGRKMKNILYPLYHMGMAAEGNVLSLLIFTGIIIGLFGIVYWVVSRSFLDLATANRGSAKRVYRERNGKVHPVGRALLQKELRRFTGSSNYMLNCGLGILIMPIAAAVLVWKGENFFAPMIAILPEGIHPLFAAGALCLLAGMNDITAPSVSLEGKNLWLAQSLPVSGSQVLTAKLKLHLLLTLLPAVPLVIAVEWVIKPDLLFAFLIPIILVLFVLLTASFGLAMNLKFPNLNWSSEIIPIKQSAGVLLSLLGGWALIVVLAVLYFLLDSFLSIAVYLMLTGICFLIADSILLRWLLTKGASIFEHLQ